MVAIVTSGASKCAKAMHLIQSAFFFVARHEVNAYPWPKCDALSGNNLQFFLFAEPGGTIQAISAPSGTDSSTLAAMPRLNLTELDQIAGDLFLKGLAESTQRVYRSGQCRYINFCSKSGLTAVQKTQVI